MSEACFSNIVALWQEGNVDEAIWEIKKMRCHLMAKMHDYGRKVDCLDFLINMLKRI